MLVLIGFVCLQNLPKRRQNNPLNRFRLGSGSRGRKPPAFRNQFGANEQQGSERKKRNMARYYIMQ